MPMGSCNINKEVGIQCQGSYTQNKPKINSTLKIMEWNDNGLLQHQQELQAVLDTEKVDLSCI
jgi:hypothetical protein